MSFYDLLSQFSPTMRDKKKPGCFSQTDYEFGLALHLKFVFLLNKLLSWLFMSNFVLVNDLVLSLRFSDDEELLQREREEVLESWKAGVL